jgi:hypothetical protein
MSKKQISAILSAGLLAACVLVAGCGPNEAILNSNSRAETPSAASNSTPQPTVTTVEKEVENMKTVGFEQIFVFRRKDGGPLEPADTEFFRTHTAQVNRRVRSDDGTALIVGTNYPIAPESFKALGERFAVEDHSGKAAAPNADVNANK